MDEAYYQEMISRNIGIFSPKEQNRIKTAKIAIAGAGAVGGHCAHILSRCGVTRFTMADPDTFSASNMNRQFGSTQSTLGKNKVEVVASEVCEINPSIIIEKFTDGVTKENVLSFLDGVDAVVDGIDFLNPEARTILMQESRRKGIHVFLAPALAFGVSVLVFGPESPTFEEFFGKVPRKNSQKDLISFGRKIFPIIPKYINKLAFAQALGKTHKIPTCAPGVMLSSVMVSADILNLICGKKKPICVPEIKWIDLIEGRYEILGKK